MGPNEPRDELTYAAAGVDIGAMDEAKEALIAALTYRRKGFGAPLPMKDGYAGVVDLGGISLAITTDGVGTKMMVARDTGIWSTVGIDCVAMNVNDLYAIGAEPIAMVDYIALNSPDPLVMAQIGEGVNRGAELADITIVAGETAALPEIVYDVDLAGTAVGIVERSRLITGDSIDAGDTVIALPSTGMHSNGYTLARRVLEVSGYEYWDDFPYEPTRSIGEVFLEPTRIYSEILSLLANHLVRGLAHITGGGLLNVRRLTQYGLDLHNALDVPPIFTFIQEEGGIAAEEMYRTFNMGMGFLIITHSSTAEEIAKESGGQIVGDVTSNAGCTVGDLKLW